MTSTECFIMKYACSSDMHTDKGTYISPDDLSYIDTWLTIRKALSIINDYCKRHLIKPETLLEKIYNKEAFCMQVYSRYYENAMPHQWIAMEDDAVEYAMENEHIMSHTSIRL